MWKNRYTALLSAALFALSASVPAEAAGRETYSEETLRLTAKAVAAECPDASFGVQIALAAVIFNRMEDPRFGDTAAQVIWGADFLTCTTTGRIALPVGEEDFAKALSAVRYAAGGMDPTDGAVWYAGGDTGRRSSRVCYGDGGYLFY